MQWAPLIEPRRDDIVVVVVVVVGVVALRRVGPQPDDPFRVTHVAFQ